MKVLNLFLLFMTIFSLNKVSASSQYSHWKHDVCNDCVSIKLEEVVAALSTGDFVAYAPQLLKKNIAKNGESITYVFSGGYLYTKLDYTQDLTSHRSGAYQVVIEHDLKTNDVKAEVILPEQGGSLEGLHNIEYRRYFHYNY